MVTYLTGLRMKETWRVACLSLLWTLVPTVPDKGFSATPQDPSVDGHNTVLVETSLTTWMPRGRTLMDLDALVRNKMASAKLTIVSDPKSPRQLTLRVDYRETRGQEYRFDQFGTIITCGIRLTHAEQGMLLDYTVRESSGDELRGTAPYIEAMQEFETNPYIYLLGDLVRGRALGGLDMTGALVTGLERMAELEKRKPDPVGLTHTMSPAESIYAEEARNNTIEELGRLQDARAVPVLIELVEHADRRVRRRSAAALGAIGSPESRPALERAARDDPDDEVRAAAATALVNLLSAPTR
jgi:hypothetical protein